MELFGIIHSCYPWFRVSNPGSHFLTTENFTERWLLNEVKEIQDSQHGKSQIHTQARYVAFSCGRGHGHPQKCSNILRLIVVVHLQVILSGWSAQWMHKLDVYQWT